MKSHLKGMVVAAAAVLVVALATGVRPGAALPLAAALACPLMMIAMMVWMHRRGHTGHDHHGAHDVTDAPMTSPSHSAAPGGR